MLEEIAKAEPSTAWSLGQNSGCSMSAPYLDPAVAREVFGPPRGILAWGPELPGAGRGVAVEGGIRVTGRWGFRDRQPARDLARRPCPDLRAGRHAAAQPERAPAIVRTVLFPKSSAEIIDNWQVIGLRGTGSDSYRVEDLFVPQKYTASRDNQAERREPGPLYRFTSGMIYAMGFSNVSLGIARGALEAFIELARDKIPRGARKTLRENNVIQSRGRAVRGEAALVARLHPRDPRGDVGRGRANGDFAPEQHARLRLAATWAIQQARDVVADVYSAAGATAIFNENPFERRLRDIHAGHPARPGPPGAFRNRRPDPPGPAAGRPHVPVRAARARISRRPQCRRRERACGTAQYNSDCVRS